MSFDIENFKHRSDDEITREMLELTHESVLLSFEAEQNKYDSKEKYSQACGLWQLLEERKKSHLKLVKGGVHV